MGYYNRYQSLELQNEVLCFPSIKLADKATDKFEVFEPGKTRFDKISAKYYGDAYWGFLIMLANPELDGLEFLIPTNTILRVPFPLDQSVVDLKSKIELNKTYYGG